MSLKKSLLAVVIGCFFISANATTSSVVKSTILKHYQEETSIQSKRSFQFKEYQLKLDNVVNSVENTVSLNLNDFDNRLRAAETILLAQSPYESLRELFPSAYEIKMIDKHYCTVSDNLGNSLKILIDVGTKRAVEVIFFENYSSRRKPYDFLVNNRKYKPVLSQQRSDFFTNRKTNVFLQQETNTQVKLTITSCTAINQ